MLSQSARRYTERNSICLDRQPFPSFPSGGEIDLGLSVGAFFFSSGLTSTDSQEKCPIPPLDKTAVRHSLKVPGLADPEPNDSRLEVTVTGESRAHRSVSRNGGNLDPAIKSYLGADTPSVRETERMYHGAFSQNRSGKNVSGIYGSWQSS